MSCRRSPCAGMALAVIVLFQNLANAAPTGSANADFWNLHMGASNSSVVDYWKRTTCDELFSEKIPAWLEAEGARGGFAAPKVWWSMCGISYIQRMRQKNANVSAIDALEGVAYQYNELDVCPVPKPKEVETPMPADTPTPVETPVPNVKPTKIASPPLPVISESLRREILDDASSIRERVAAMCCADRDSTCLNWIRTIPFRWCDSKSPVRACMNGAGHNQRFEFENYKEYITDTYLRPVLKDYSATIYLKLDADEQGNWKRSFSDIAHELGHACSNIRRKLMIKLDRSTNADGYVSEYARELGALTDEATGKSFDPCVVSEAGLSIYHSMFRGFGASEETFQCVSGLVTKYGHQKRLTQETCTGCPMSYFEEALATWAQAYALPDKFLDFRLPWFFCTGFRDDTHLSTLDLVGCFLKTPSIQRIFRKTTGCR